MSTDKYQVVTGEDAGRDGIMVGRFCDPSYNDIQLRFPDGSAHWYHYCEVRPVRDDEGAADEGTVEVEVYPSDFIDDPERYAAAIVAATSDEQCREVLESYIGTGPSEEQAHEVETRLRAELKGTK